MNLDSLRAQIENELKEVHDKKTVEQLRVKFLGRKAELTKQLRGLKNKTIEERRTLGPKLQQLKKDMEALLRHAEETVRGAATEVNVKRFDVTKPGKPVKTGHLHPLTLLEKEIRDIFLSMNFSAVEGPEVETEWYNFDALNIPPSHPARDLWDTFWLKTQTNAERTQNHAEKSQRKSASSQRQSALLLRTHTSPMQIRYMQEHKPPFQIIVPGRVYRYEATDATHDFQFRQLEGLMVGKDISLANFKYVIEEFLKRLFGRSVAFELRPSYYPFVEPGVDVYMKWNGQWLEVAGAGMVHPNVFRAVKYNPYDWQGFAFGFGLNRLAMIKYKIPDVRLFYSGDIRFTEQF